VPALGFCVIAMIPQSRLLILNPTHTFRGVVVASLAFFGCGAQENGGILADSAIPCSSNVTYGPRQSAQQLHRSTIRWTDRARGLLPPDSRNSNGDKPSAVNGS